MMKKEGLFSLLSSILVVIVGLLIGFLILFFSNSEQAGPAFLTILTFGFSSMRNVGDVLAAATPIILTGLSVAFAFKTGLFNIGASGQFMIGGFVAIYISVELTHLPPPVRIVLAVVAAALSAALWGAIPGLLKAYRNVHEVISSIMTNYIAMFLVNFLIMNGMSWRGRYILNPIFDQGRGTTTRMPESSVLPDFGLQNIFRDELRYSRINIGIIIAILVAILVYIILEKTTFGYELKACGFNRNAAKYAGVNENKNIVFAMMISGALAGLAGALHYMNGAGLSMNTIDMLAPEGFTGISVAFLGLSHPLAVIFSGTLISYLSLAGNRLQHYGFSSEFIAIIVSVIIYFCAFVSLVKLFLMNKYDKFSKPKEDS